MKSSKIGLRILFTLAALTATAGAVTAWIALSPTPRLVAAVLLLVAFAATVAGLIQLRKKHHERLFIRQSIRAYAPYVIVAAVLLTGLRMWLILMPPEATPLLKLPPAEQNKKIATDILTLAKTNTAALVKIRECEKIYNYYKGFSHIDVVTQPHLHAEAFAIAYAAYLQRLRLIDGLSATGAEVSGETADLVATLTDDATALRLYAGYAYLQTQAGNIENEQIKTLLENNITICDKFPDVLTREIKNPKWLFRRYWHGL